MHVFAHLLPPKPPRCTFWIPAMVESKGEIRPGNDSVSDPTFRFTLPSTKRDASCNIYCRCGHKEGEASTGGEQRAAKQRNMARVEATMDGSRIKALVGDTAAFERYAVEKFRELSHGDSGCLSRQDLQPLILALGDVLGLPPRGSSPQTDRIYDQLVVDEFLQGHPEKQSVTIDEFTPTLRDILLGIADGLERDPVALQTVDGDVLEKYVNSSMFEGDAISIFFELDEENSGKIPGKSLMQAVTKFPAQRGMPPTSFSKVMVDIVEPCLASLPEYTEKWLTEDKFVTACRSLLFHIASRLKKQPLTIAHTEKCYDGSTISNFLKDQSRLKQTFDETWAYLSPFKEDDGELSKGKIYLALDFLAPSVGLPPIGAIDEMDGLVNDSLKMVISDTTPKVGKDEFQKCMVKVLGSIMLQLEGKPVWISVSRPADEHRDVGLGLQ